MAKKIKWKSICLLVKIVKKFMRNLLTNNWLDNQTHSTKRKKIQIKNENKYKLMNLRVD